MANADYEQLLRERGYELVPNEVFEPVQLPGASFGTRSPLLTGRKQVGAHTIDVQLQQERTSRSSALAVVARVRGAKLNGEGALAPHGILRSGY